MASLIFNWKRVEAELRILKQSFEHRERRKIVAPGVQKTVFSVLFRGCSVLAFILNYSCYISLCYTIYCSTLVYFSLYN